MTTVQRKTGSAFATFGGLTPTRSYYPSALATTYAAAALPNNTTTFNLFYTPTLVTTWQSRAASSPTDLSSATPATKGMAQTWVCAAYYAQQFVAGAYPAPQRECTPAQYWGLDSNDPASYAFEACQTAFVYRTGYNIDGTVSSGAVSSARLAVLTTWLLAAINMRWIDGRHAGFVAPASGTAWNGQSVLNVAWLDRYDELLALVFVYDMIRADMSATDRLTVETKLRQLGDWCAQSFNEGSGAPYFGEQFDKYNIPVGSAISGASDEYYTAGAYPSYAYVTGASAFGPRTPTAGMAYNNRMSLPAKFITLLGMLLSEPVFLSTGLRYWGQVLRFQLNSDGSFVEWGERAYNYAIPQQGKVYANVTLDGLITCAAALRRSGGGDHLFTFSTSVALPQQVSAVKSLALAIDVHNNLLTQTGAQATWYAVNPAVSGAASQVKSTTLTIGTPGSPGTGTLNTHLGYMLQQFKASGIQDWTTNQWEDVVHDLSFVQAYDYYNSLGASVPAGTSRTGAVLAGCINAIARRSSSLWNTATGGSPTVMPAWHSTTTIASTLTRPNGGAGTRYTVVPGYGSFYTLADGAGVVAAPLFMYAP